MALKTWSEIKADEAETARYESAWRTREWLLAAVGLLVASLLPVTGLVIWLFASAAVTMAMWMTWIVAMLALSGWLTWWPCPRCGEPFHMPRSLWQRGVGIGRSIYRVRCGSCGLARPVYTAHGRALVRGEFDDPDAS